MTKPEEELFKTLQDLSEEEFKTFKWFLKQDDNVEGLSGIAVAKLENAGRHDTVDLMVQKYHGPGALKVTMKVLEKISRNDLMQHLQAFSSSLKDLKTQTPLGKHQNNKRTKSPLKSVQQFAVDVTLDPDTAHPALFLSDDGKQVHDGGILKNLPDNPKRFNRCVNVLGKQSFSSGKSYFEVQVAGKTAWTVGVAIESIDRTGIITLSPSCGLWTICLDNEEHKAIDEPLVPLPLEKNPKKVGVFVDYEDGLISFYDVDTADLLYSFTGCAFIGKLYPFFSPCTNDGGINSAPLVIYQVNHPQNQSELKSVKQFAVDVTLDPDTAHPNLILSEDGKEVHHGDVRKNLPDNQERFSGCVNVLGKQSFSSGRSYFEVQVAGKTAWTVGVAKGWIDRKGNITLCPENGYCTLLLQEGKYYAVDNQPMSLTMKSHLQRLGVLVNYEDSIVCFYDVDTADLLYCFTGCSFTEKLYPFFSPCTNDGGINSAPLVIYQVNHPQNQSELTSVKQFAVDVTMDPDTAHPNLILSEDGKQVHHGDVRKDLPDNPERFYRCVNVLGKQSFSSGRSFFEVQVAGKTAWTVGVAKESIDRKGDVTVGPEEGYWTISQRKVHKYYANDNPALRLLLKSHPQIVGVFVNYEEGLVCFYDVETADLLYAFTDCFFTERLFPCLSPCKNEHGRNSKPLIICPVKNFLELLCFQSN